MFHLELWKIIDFRNQAHLKFGESWSLLDYEKQPKENYLLILSVYIQSHKNAPYFLNTNFRLFGSSYFYRIKSGNLY